MGCPDASGEIMRRRDKTGGNAAKAEPPKTLKRESAQKITGRRSSPVSNKDTDVARLTRERDEAVERQTATAEILDAISGSPTDTQPVFDAIVQSGLSYFLARQRQLCCLTVIRCEQVRSPTRIQNAKKHGDAAFPVCSTGPKCMARRSSIAR